MKLHAITPAVHPCLRPLPASLLSLATIRRLEAHWLEETGPGELMASAGAAVAKVALAMWQDMPAQAPVILLVGPGNNGGDALVAGRILRRAGLDVRAVGVAGLEQSPPSAADARAAWQAWRDDGQVIHPLARLLSWLWPDGDAPVVPDAHEAREGGWEPGHDPQGASSHDHAGDDASAQGAGREAVWPDPLAGQGVPGGLDAAGQTPAAPALLIDGLFGIGLDRPMRGALATLVRQINQGRVPVLAIDVPSGLDADRGAPVGDDDAPVLMARQTVTMIADKPGLHTGLGLRAAGRVWVAPLSDRPLEAELVRIGEAAPAGGGASARSAGAGVSAASAGGDVAGADDAAVGDVAGVLLNGPLASLLMPPRDVDAHKGSAGDVLVVGGRLGMAGAARLAARGAVMAGAGRVWVTTEAADGQNMAAGADTADLADGADRPGHAAPVDPQQPEIMRCDWPGAGEAQEPVFSHAGDEDGFSDWPEAPKPAKGDAEGDGPTEDGGKALPPPFPGRDPVLVLGCGLGRDDTAWQWLQWSLESAAPVVIDADALGLLAEDLWDLLDPDAADEDAMEAEAAGAGGTERNVRAGDAPWSDDAPWPDDDFWPDEDDDARSPGRARPLDVALSEAYGTVEDSTGTAAASMLSSVLYAGVDADLDPEAELDDDFVGPETGPDDDFGDDLPEDGGPAPLMADDDGLEPLIVDYPDDDDLLLPEEIARQAALDVAEAPFDDFAAPSAADPSWGEYGDGDDGYASAAPEDEPVVEEVPAVEVARIMTPHPLEAARLLGVPVSVVQTDRLGSALQLAHAFDAVVVLKGAGTVVATPDGRYAINTSGHPVLATAGTGDVLAGTIGALLAGLLRAQCPPAEAAWQAACGGVWLHGRAGERVAAQFGPRGVPASALPRQYPAIMGALARLRPTLPG